MCGINGFFNYSGSVLHDEYSLIEKMNAALSHRGPDDSGRWADKQNKIYFGHLRLSIIDLSPTGHQPMISESGNAIVFNGEIYNYQEIKNTIRDFQFKSKSDTEVLLYLYEKYGQDCLKFLNGMFAFAIWDNQKQELFMARDRMGKKPLYYVIQNGIFAFASEIKALLTLPWVKASLDEKALYHFLTFNHLPPPLTMFKNIFKLEPASKITISANGFARHETYWEAERMDFSSKDENELKEIVLTGLKKSVDYRMVSDVPVGAFLSGGVDSSAIVALISGKTSYPVKTYSIGFENAPGYDELKHAQKVSKIFKTDHYEKIVTPADIKNLLPEIINIFDEPLADSTCIPIYFISQLARKNGTIVVLTGDGPDELFLGYTNWMKYLKMYPWFHIYSNLPSFVKKSAVAIFGNNYSPASEILERGAKNQELFWGGAKSFKESSKRNFLSENFKRKINNIDSYEVILNYKSLFNKMKPGSADMDDGTWMSYLGFKFLITNRYLFRADRLGMANSIEARMPFLDYNFVNTAMSIPTYYKIKNKIPKYILKKSLEGILAKDILYRKKQGFNVPLKEWAGEIMIDYVETRMKSFCKNLDIFKEDGLKFQINEIKKGNKNFTNNLWTIYFL
ncbi:MAG TPA: asparagine synthase (glutamine-hydrolyzing), partial [Bacteroidia bacterium]|nr:asparagine synthase (glutamine-hydrolyzing) [Bacteroidia bacterium]